MRPRTRTLKIFFAKINNACILKLTFIFNSNTQSYVCLAMNLNYIVYGFMQIIRKNSYYKAAVINGDLHSYVYYLYILVCIINLKRHRA